MAWVINKRYTSEIPSNYKLRESASTKGEAHARAHFIEGVGSEEKVYVLKLGDRYHIYTK